MLIALQIGFELSSAVRPAPSLPVSPIASEFRDVSFVLWGIFYSQMHVGIRVGFCGYGSEDADRSIPRSVLASSISSCVLRQWLACSVPGEMSLPLPRPQTGPQDGLSFPPSHLLRIISSHTCCRRSVICLSPLSHLTANYTSTALDDDVLATRLYVSTYCTAVVRPHKEFTFRLPNLCTGPSFLPGLKL